MVFLISGQGYFTFLYQHIKYITERVEEKNNYGLGLAPSAKLVTLLCIMCFCGLMWACTQAKLPQATSNADLSSRVGLPGICRSTGLSSCLSDFCWLVSFLPFSHFLTDLLLTALWDLPSLVLFWSLGSSCMQALCVGFVPKQTKGFSD